MRAAFAAHVDYVQVREKDLPDGALASIVQELADCPEKQDSRLLVNERWDIAASCGADGVHLPAGSLPPSMLRSQAGAGMIIGVSCHHRNEVAQAVREGVSYILLGPIFETLSKPGATPLGLPFLKEVCESCPVPIYALGGIDARHAADCIQAGAAGVAGIRLFQEAPNLDALCRRLSLLEKIGD